MNEIINLIRVFAEGNDLDFRDDYSGRCMYGKNCVGLICDSSMSVLIELCDYLHAEGVETVSDILGTPCTDSMGLSTILYFPRLVSN